MELEGVLYKWRGYIEKYEAAEAKYQWIHWKYYNGQRDCCTKEPSEPKVNARLHSHMYDFFQVRLGIIVDAWEAGECSIDFYKCRIQEYDDFAEKDYYDTIVEKDTGRVCCARHIRYVCMLTSFDQRTINKSIRLFLVSLDMGCICVCGYDYKCRCSQH